MSGKSLRAAKKREYRAKHTKQYQKLTFIAQYTQQKYNAIYKEAENFYEELVWRYPRKTKLSTCPKFKAWEFQIRKDPMSGTTSDEESTTQKSTTSSDKESTTQNPTTYSYEEITVIDSSSSDIQLNIPLMSSHEVLETRDSVMLQNIYPSLQKEISPEIIDQVIQELQESDVTSEFFNHIDEDLCDILNDEINATMNDLSMLEKELLK